MYLCSVSPPSLYCPACLAIVIGRRPPESWLAAPCEYRAHCHRIASRRSRLHLLHKIPIMTFPIPRPLPATVFPSLTSLVVTPASSSRSSTSYREERTVRCCGPTQSDSENNPQALACRYADFLLSFTGEDEAIFRLHHDNSSPQRSPETQDANVDLPTADHVVYATRDQPQKCTINVLECREQQITTDFALVFGEAQSEALKVCSLFSVASDRLIDPRLTQLEALHSNTISELSHHQLRN